MKSMARIAIVIMQSCQCISVQYHVRKSSVFQPFFHGETATCVNGFHTGEKKKKNVAHGLYSIIANFWTNIL